MGDDRSTGSGQAPASRSLDKGDLIAAASNLAIPDEVAEAVRTLIRWAGDDSAREGLRDTPRRVARACRVHWG